MNKIVRGKRYNTETAQLIGVYESNEPKDSDFWEREELYRKRTGEFFLVGKGGAMTEYGVPSINGTGKTGEALQPVTPEYASQWCEENLTADEYENVFGAVEEDGSRSTACITLPSSLLNSLKTKAQQKNMTFSKYMEKIILKGMSDK